MNHPVRDFSRREFFSLILKGKFTRLFETTISPLLRNLGPGKGVAGEKELTRRTGAELLGGQPRTERPTE